MFLWIHRYLFESYNVKPLENASVFDRKRTSCLLMRTMPLFLHQDFPPPYLAKSSILAFDIFAFSLAWLSALASTAIFTERSFFTVNTVGWINTSSFISLIFQNDLSATCWFLHLLLFVTEWGFFLLFAELFLRPP